MSTVWSWTNLAVEHRLESAVSCLVMAAIYNCNGEGQRVSNFPFTTSKFQKHKNVTVKKGFS